MRKILTQCFRGYAVIAVLAAGFTALWAFGIVSVSLPLVGYAWLGVAVVGTVVAVGMLSKKGEVIESDATPDRIEAFEEATVTGRPFDLYLGALAMWAAVSFGWVLGGMSAEGLTIGGASADGLAIVGYGWFAIAAYGVFIGIKIAMNHKEDLTIAVDPTETLETGSEN